MVSSVTGQSAAQLLLNTAADSSRAAKTAKAASPTDRLLAGLENTDPEQAEKLRKKLEEAKGILARIKAAKVDFDEQRKTAAREKIERIKEQLKMLRMLAAVNPEAAARRAAQLSRELSAAVKEYAGASGGAGAGVGAAATAGVGGGAETASPVGTAGAEGAQVASAGPEAVTAAVPTAPAVAAAGETGVAEGASPGKDIASGKLVDESQGAALDGAEDAGVPGARSDGTLDDDGGEDGDNGGISIRERVQEQVAEANRSFGASRADQEFVREVREIKNALKAIIEAAKRKLEQEGNSGADQDIKDAEKALNDVDASVAQISTAGTAGLAGAVNILA